MNQILSVENKKKEKNNSPTDIKKIIRVFCIIVLLFGIGLIGKSSYAILQNMNQSSSVQELKPTVDIGREGNNVIIKVSHSKEITKMIYHWNQNGEETVINGNGSGQVEATLNLPVGNNTLYLTVIDITGQATSFERSYVTDAQEPQVKIELVQGNSNKVRITAKDVVALSFITYRWDEEQEIRIEPSEDSKAQIEAEIEAPKGQHTLTVNAVNTNNITKTEEQDIKIVTKPKITVVPDETNPKYLILTITDEEAFKGAVFTVNGKEFPVDYSSVREKKFEYWIEVQEGENKITVRAYNFDDAEETFEGSYTYHP